MQYRCAFQAQCQPSTSFQYAARLCRLCEPVNGMSSPFSWTVVLVQLNSTLVQRKDDILEQCTTCCRLLDLGTTLSRSGRKRRARLATSPIYIIISRGVLPSDDRPGSKARFISTRSPIARSD